eukprot:259087-Pleurochrysis_carterae.AAC.3
MEMSAPAKKEKHAEGARERIGVTHPQGSKIRGHAPISAREALWGRCERRARDHLARLSGIRSQSSACTCSTLATQRGARMHTPRRAPDMPSVFRAMAASCDAE